MLPAIYAYRMLFLLSLSFFFSLSLAFSPLSLVSNLQRRAATERAVSWAGPTILVTNHSQENRVFEILDWSRLSLKRRTLAPFHQGTILTSGLKCPEQTLSRTLSHTLALSLLCTLTKCAHPRTHAHTHTHTLTYSQLPLEAGNQEQTSHQTFAQNDSRAFFPIVRKLRQF